MIECDAMRYTQVYRGRNKSDIVGVILVKELLEYVKVGRPLVV